MAVRIQFKEQKRESVKILSSELDKLKALKHSDPLYASLDSEQSRCGLLVPLKLAESYFASDKVIGQSVLDTFNSFTDKNGPKKAVYHFGIGVSDRLLEGRLVRSVMTEWRDFFLVGRSVKYPKVEVVANLGFGTNRFPIDPRKTQVNHSAISIRANGANLNFEPLAWKSVKVDSVLQDQKTERLIEFNRAFSNFRNRESETDARIYAAASGFSNVKLFNLNAQEYANLINAKLNERILELARK
ncbi:MAG TPA: hypothetical protein VNF06_02335 [Candidatus Aquilonibacter sp.]|nr:hypothetical protein [Candidatus Aquilonibacter sp.]